MNEIFITSSTGKDIGNMNIEEVPEHYKLEYCEQPFIRENQYVIPGQLEPENEFLLITGCFFNSKSDK